MKKAAMFFLIISVGILLGGCARESKAPNDSETCIVFHEGIPYSGAVSDNTDSEGQQLFEVTDNSSILVSVEGKWNGNILAGETKLTLQDGSVIEVNYKDNVAEGEARRTYKNGAYDEYKYKNGYPSGRILCYDANGRIIDVDRYYSNRRISEWCELAEPISPGQLLRKPDVYYQKPVFIEGEITDILEDDKKRYIAIKNQEGQSAVGFYKNTKVATPQALVPEMKVGDMVTAYGFFEESDVLDTEKLYKSVTALELKGDFDLAEYKELDKRSNVLSCSFSNDALYSTIPIIELLCVKTEEEYPVRYDELDSAESKTYEYEQLITNPYVFSYFKLSDTVQVVKSVVDYENAQVQLILKKDENQLYYGVLKFKEEDTLPMVGETITFSANLEGCYKLQRREKKGTYENLTYVLVPAMTIEEIK